MKNYCIIFILILFSLCSEKKTVVIDSEITNQGLNNNELVIIFNRKEERTELKSFGNNPRESFYFNRENFDSPFDDPNLHISVFHNLDHQTTGIKRKELDQMNVWFDSEMDYMDWFGLNFEKYYIIYQDEYLVKGSLDPEYSFTAYEVKIHTGGVE